MLFGNALNVKTDDLNKKQNLFEGYVDELNFTVKDDPKSLHQLGNALHKNLEFALEKSHEKQ